MRSAIAAASIVAVGLAWTGSARAQLAPPPPLQPQPQPMWTPFAPAPTNQPYGQYQGQSVTQQQLEAAEREDSGRGFEIAWVNVEGGGSYGNWGHDATSGGAIAGIGAGIRFVTWTLGARVRIHPWKDFTVMQFLGEAGLHIPTGSWDPYVKLRAGYARTSDVPAPIATSLGGFDAGVAGGVDYYLSALFSLGLEASGDLVLFGSPASTGGLAAGTAHAGLHFDL